MTEFEASQLLVFHLESHEEVLKSLRLIPAFRVEMSSWSEAISISVMELLDRKLLVSQMVIASALGTSHSEVVVLYVYSMT